MFTLYKLIGQLVMPLPLGLLVAGFALLLPHGAGRPLAAGALAVLWLLATPLLGRELLRVVDGRPPLRQCGELPTADALVVLSGGFPNRELCALHLLRLGKAPLVLFSGRTGPLNAERLANLLALAGLGPDRVILETSSRNTLEGALAFAELAHQRDWKRVLLASDAYHLPRALQRYRTPGVEVVPAAFPELRLAPRAAFAERPLEEWFTDQVPGAGGLQDSTLALRELIGMALGRS